MSEDPDNYEIGFRKPPHWSRFKAGQSGNPGGRPPKAKAKEANRASKGAPMASGHFVKVLREYRRTVTVQENGKPIKLSMEELAIRAQLNAAAKGNHHAQREVMRQARKLGVWEEEEKRLAAQAQEAEQALKLRTYNHIVQFKQEREVAWFEAEAQGTEPEPVWPLSDDILIFPERKE